MSNSVTPIRNLSVVIPCFNEENTIEELIHRVLAQPQVFEVIVIDDCSTDLSTKKLATIVDSRLVVHKNEKNVGKGASIWRGIKLAKAEYLVIQDADLEYSPEEYSRLLAPLVDGRADAVFGSRFLTYEARRALYYWHRLGNNFLTTLSNMLIDLVLSQKLLPSSHVCELESMRSQFRITVALMQKERKLLGKMGSGPFTVL